MSIVLTPISATKEKVQEVVVLGSVEYQHGRMYPWLGQHGCVCQYFATKSEAVQYARTGKA